MSKIEQLLKKLCPNGVEYKKLGEIATIERGNGLQKKDFVPAGVPCIHYGQLYTRFKTFIKSAVTFVDNKTASNLKHLVQGDILMAVTSENVEDVCKCIAWLGDEDVVVGGHTAIIHHKQNPMYLAYWFQTEDFFSQKRKLAHGTKVIDVTPKKLEDVVLPVPPLEIQREVVEVLDKFALLTAELTAELEKRKKQYEHYRRALLAEGNREQGIGNRCGVSNWPMVKLGDVCNFVYGYTDKAKDSGNARFIRITDINDGGHLNHDGAKYIILNQEAVKYLLNKGDLVMARTGATYGKTLYFDSDEAAVYASFLIRIVPDNARLNNRYYWHFSQCGLYWEQAKRLVTTGGQPQFNTGAISQVLIPLPPLAEQERIVKILDRFDKLCNDLTSGLPAEIAARKKQYEYYRDKLLSFKRAG